MRCSLVVKGEDRNQNVQSMPLGIDDDRLVHYLAGECTDEEKKEIEAWIAADAAHKRYVERLRKVWQAAAKTPPGVGNIDRMWNKLRDRIGPLEKSSAEKGERPSRSYQPRSGRHSMWRQYSRIGAIATFVVVLALIAGQALDEFEVEPEESAMREVATETGQRARVTLHDGTQVTLNAESKLTLPVEFAEDERVVHLQGEAYFQVISDKERPFKIKVKGAVTEVLGTKFNVGAYPDEPDVEVVVDEGKVAVHPEGGRGDQEVLLEAHQLAQLSRKEEHIVRREVNVSDYLAWMDGRLVFRDAPIEEVARKLRRWYGLEVELAPTLQDVDRLNASFKEESVEEVLNIIAETLNLRYERNGRRVAFLPAERR